MKKAARQAASRALAEQLRLLNVHEDAQSDPKALINEIRFFDPTTEKWVEFRMFPPEGWEAPAVFHPDGSFRFHETGSQDWFWQSLVIDWWDDPELNKFLMLKARQLGITLLACSYALWLMLYRPGSASVAYSYTEDEAKKLPEATWAMFQSLPEELKKHVTVVTPARTESPSEWIRLKHEDGRTSTFQALPATKKAGHGTRIRFAIMDEVAYQEYARDIYKAINPATSRGGTLVMLSTANGVSNKETGEGNFFHHLWTTRKEKRLNSLFLPWNLEPTRSEEWYQKEAMALDEVERNQQYPLNEHDAFMLSGALYFDRDALAYYRQETIPPLFAGQFIAAGRREAVFKQFRDGVIEVYEKPKADAQYAIGCDTATGKGSDYTSADVIDLSSGAIVAHFHAKMEAPRAAIQLHYLGKWFNNALICVERQGGYGEALIISLRDGTENLPKYTRLYRHKKFTRGDQPLAEEYGHPMGPQARASVLDGLKSWIRDRSFPWLSDGHVGELGTFVYADTIPSPRAQDGCNDDRVMSLGLAVEMFRQFGHRPERRRRWKQATYQPPPTRQHS